MTEPRAAAQTRETGYAHTYSLGNTLPSTTVTAPPPSAAAQRVAASAGTTAAALLPLASRTAVTQTKAATVGSGVLRPVRFADTETARIARIMQGSLRYFASEASESDESY